MTTTFPTTLDAFPTQATLAGHLLATDPHSQLHANLGDSVAALEAKVGINGSAVTTSIDYFLAHGGASGFGAGSNPYRLTASGSSAPSSPSGGDQWYDTTNHLEKVYDDVAGVWITVTPVTLALAHSGTTTSTSYTASLTGDSGTNPFVTILTGTQALVIVSASCANGTASDGAAVGVAVSGATTVAAADATALIVTNNGSTAALAIQHAVCYKFTGLTAGSNTFTLNYRSITGGTSTFLNRSISVEAVPAGG